MEKNTYTQFMELITNHGSKDIDVVTATVTAPPPALKIRLDADSLELEAEDLIVAKWLTKHKRSVTLTSSQVTDAMTSAGTGPHTHDITSLTVSGEIEFTDELKAGDQVMVAKIDNGQNYFIYDWTVRY